MLRSLVHALWAAMTKDSTTSRGGAATGQNIGAVQYNVKMIDGVDSQRLMRSLTFAGVWNTRTSLRGMYSDLNRVYLSASYVQVHLQKLLVIVPVSANEGRLTKYMSWLNVQGVVSSERGTMRGDAVKARIRRRRPMCSSSESLGIDGW